MRRRSVLLCAVAAGALACRPAPLSSPPPPPDAEFLAEAGDSTFWVRSAADGLHVRGSPITLARLGGRFYELYTAGDGVSYERATFDWERLYRRDLLTGDSTLVFDDATSRRAAARYAAAHPDEAPLDDDEDAPEAVPLSVSGEVDLVAVHGPYASVEQRFSAERDDADAVASTRRLVVDLRTGQPAPLAVLFGRDAAVGIEVAGRRAFGVAVDSIRRASGETAELAQRALANIVFDPESFTLSDARGMPVVAFVAPGRGEHGAYALPLAPVAAPTPAWWADALAVLPASSPDSTSDVWVGPRYRVLATYDSSGAVTLALGDTLGREWPAVRTGAPVERLYRLDAPVLGADARHALARAFDEGALYAETARAVRWTPHEQPRRRSGRAPHHRRPAHVARPTA